MDDPREPDPPTEDIRTGLSVDAIKRDFLDNLFFVQGRFQAVATRNDHYLALAYTIRDRLLRRWLRTLANYREHGSRTVSYLSAEYLLGPHLANNLMNLGLEDTVRRAMHELGFNLDELIAQEEEPGLGNGGLGRLAACFMDSLATLEIPAIGYGIRYEFGIFDQEIRDGWQVEVTDKWLRLGNPWEIARPEIAMDVKLGGRTRGFMDEKGRYRVEWMPDRVVKGIPFDTPILGYRVTTANLLRLWKAEACESFDFQAFNAGDYYGAVHSKVFSENLTKVLYPNDEPAAGKELRLEQQYFFVSCSLQDMVRIYRQRRQDLRFFHEKFAVQLNDTHPSIAIAELMRILVDEHEIGWDEAFEITRRTFGYTNHTLLPEALERWPVALLARVLPRHMEIIYEINRRFLTEVRLRFPDDDGAPARMSLIDESGERYVRMAHLAVVGSHSINGVARLHTELLKSDVLRDFASMWPERFHNITNGVTPRRFLVLINPRLTRLIAREAGWIWPTRLDALKVLEGMAADKGFREEWRQVKRDAKADLAALTLKRTGVAVDPDSLFDVHVKRIHEYKRQHLNLLHIITLYNRLKSNPAADIAPRTFFFAGKAAPGYRRAKLIIRLIHGVAEIVNADADIGGRLKVVFLPDLNVTNAQLIYPAADLSEQISTAGKEASGTGNMKFAFNGALTIGTLDGANVEIREAVGAENFFLFGLTAAQGSELKARGYDPGAYVNANPELRRALEQIGGGMFSRGDTALYAPLVRSLLERDEFMLLADFASYVECQEAAGRAFHDTARWTEMSILNVARIGRFSSDRAIREYCSAIWKVKPVPVDL